jgi:hypothetical protein
MKRSQSHLKEMRIYHECLSEDIRVPALDLNPEHPEKEAEVV